MSAEMIAVINRWQDAFARRDLEGYARLYADSAVLQSPFAGAQVGPEGALKVVRTFLAAFPDATLMTESPIVDGERVALVSSMSGTDVGGLMGLPPSHRQFRFPIVFLFEIRNGKIVRDRRIYDFTGFLVQLGVLKAKPA